MDACGKQVELAAEYGMVRVLQFRVIVENLASGIAGKLHYLPVSCKIGYME